MNRTPRPRKISPAQLEQIQDEARRRWNRMMERFPPDQAPVIIPARRPRRSRGRRDPR